jgi:glycosyltransferase involved in cell wall biosynthesis
MSTPVSIVICTRNNCANLARTLVALNGVLIPEHLNCELIIVDNASTDATPEIVKTLTLPSLEIRYLYESRPGLSYARNAALGVARGDMILWTDDDVRPPSNWIESMCAPLLAARYHATAGGVNLAPSLERPWMTCLHKGWLASTECVSVNNPRRMVGANMIFSREVLNKVPAFDNELGAGALGFHEETLFSYQLERAGYRLTTAFDVVVEHHFEESRLLRKHWLDSAKKMGRSDAYWIHHWEHDEIAEPELQLAMAKRRLSEWRSQHANEYRVSEGTLEDELAMVRDVSLYKQFLIERMRQRNYDQFGLVKK